MGGPLSTEGTLDLTASRGEAAERGLTSIGVISEGSETLQRQSRGKNCDNELNEGSEKTKTEISRHHGALTLTNSRKYLEFSTVFIRSLPL